MKKSFKKSEYFLAGVLGLIAAFPLAVEPPAFASDATLDAALLAGTTIQQKALKNYKNYRASRRDYQASQELCVELKKIGKIVECPDINDAIGITVFLKTHDTLKRTSATGSFVREKLTTADLNITQLNQLRRYQRLNSCPESLKNYLPGFFELCYTLIDDNPVLRRGIVGPKGVTSMPPAPTLDEIIEANQTLKKSR